MTFAKFNQFQQAPRASAPEPRESARDILANKMMFSDETIEHFEMLESNGQHYSACALIDEAIIYESGVSRRRKMARKAKSAKRLVRILTKAMLRAMEQGEEDLSEDLADAIHRHTTAWADFHNAAQ